MHHKVKHDALDSVPVRTLLLLPQHEWYIPQQPRLHGAIHTLLAFAGSNNHLHRQTLGGKKLTVCSMVADLSHEAG